MKKIVNNEELKGIQLDVLLALDQFCIDHGIKYSLAAGSLIGAIRHKGYIPWDDDIDVYLLRKDYEKLISQFPDCYNGIYSILSLERSTNWGRPYGKMYDNRTLLKEYTPNQHEDLGVGIDIFPIDDVPDSHAKWVSFNKKRMILRNIFIFKSLRMSAKRNVLKNIIVLIGRILLYPFSYRMIAKKMNEYAQIHNNHGYRHVYENCLGVYNSENPWLKESFDKVIGVEFEGHIVKVMIGYNDYLTCVYGNYMELPPLNKRTSHHGHDAYWK